MWIMEEMKKMDSCPLLPDFPLSARRQRAAGSLWSDKGRWLCGPAPQSGPWGALQTEEQLEGKNTSSQQSSGMERGRYRKKNITMSREFQAETETHHHGQSRMGVPVESFHAAIYTKVCIYIHEYFLNQ